MPPLNRAHAPVRSSTVRALHVLGLIYTLLLLGLSAQQVLAPQRSGLLAITQILAPYLFVPLLVFVPLALRRNRLALRLALLALLIVFGLRFGPDFIPPRTPTAVPNAVRITAMTWNARYDNQRLDAIRNAIATSTADVIALQELSIEQAQMIAGDQGLIQRYPYQLLTPAKDARGLGLLSRFPLLATSGSEIVATMWARLDLGGGHTLFVVAAHPARGVFRSFSYDPSRRDGQIRKIRATIARRRQGNEPLLIMGDFNTNEREPTYADLTAGLQDAQRIAGWGWGNTWRPPRVAWLPFALLRIDYMLSSPDVMPLALTRDCTPRGSDHCTLSGVFAVP